MSLHDLVNVHLGQGHTIAHNEARAKPSRLASHTSFRPAEVLGDLFGAIDGGQSHGLSVADTVDVTRSSTARANNAAFARARAGYVVE